MIRRQTWRATVLEQSRVGTLDFSLKVASRCNLDCSYCYVYNHADTTWRTRPPLMSDEIFVTTIGRIREHCLSSGQEAVEITFHGGEPCLVGARRFGRWCEEARRRLSDIIDVKFCIQTNGTLITDEWIDALRRNDVIVGVSLDGPASINDVHRVDKRGRGSHARVERGIAALMDAGIDVGVLAVIQLGADGLGIHEHLTSLGFRMISYLLPHMPHEAMTHVRQAYGPTPCADYLMPILEAWWKYGTVDQEIALFLQMSRVILGGRSRLDLIGNSLLSFVFVETDGAISGLDTLKVGAHGLAETGLNVRDNRFIDIRAVSDLHRRAIFDGMPVPAACEGCRETLTCGGGHLADRFSVVRGFDNQSIWCDDLLALFGRVRELLGVSPRETVLRRELLSAEIGRQ